MKRMSNRKLQPVGASDAAMRVVFQGFQQVASQVTKASPNLKYLIKSY